MTRTKANNKPKNDLVGDCTPLLLGCATDDPKMPIELKMSVGLARLLLGLLVECRSAGQAALFAQVLEDTITAQKTI